jgi:hypothetical protein
VSGGLGSKYSYRIALLLESVYVFLLGDEVPLFWFVLRE